MRAAGPDPMAFHFLSSGSTPAAPTGSGLLQRQRQRGPVHGGAALRVVRLRRVNHFVLAFVFQTHAEPGTGGKKTKVRAENFRAGTVTIPRERGTVVLRYRALYGRRRSWEKSDGKGSDTN